MTPRAESLRFETRVPPRARAGEAVPVTLAVHNAGKDAVPLNLMGRTVAFDIVVTATDGTVVWRRLEGSMIPAVLRIEFLAPGTELTFSDRWMSRARDGRPVAPGQYTIHGAFPTDTREPLRTPVVVITIEPHD